jgi:hypothetical protein
MALADHIHPRLTLEPVEYPMAQFVVRDLAYPGGQCSKLSAPMQALDYERKCPANSAVWIDAPHSRAHGRGSVTAAHFRIFSRTVGPESDSGRTLAPGLRWRR